MIIKDYVARQCDDCQFDISMQSQTECTDHKWHYINQFERPDMCCICGIDWEMMFK
jgi:hypothetical protein